MPTDPSILRWSARRTRTLGLAATGGSGRTGTEGRSESGLDGFDFFWKRRVAARRSKSRPAGPCGISASVRAGRGEEHHRSDSCVTALAGDHLESGQVHLGADGMVQASKSCCLVLSKYREAPVCKECLDFLAKWLRGNPTRIDGWHQWPPDVSPTCPARDTTWQRYFEAEDLRAAFFPTCYSGRPQIITVRT